MKDVAIGFLVLVIFAATSVGQEETAGAADLNRRAVSEIAAGNFARAIPNLQEVIRMHPKLAEAYFNLGTAYELEKMHDKARAALIRATQLRPSYAAAFNQLGTIELARGDLQSAFRYLTQAVLLEPESATAHYNLGIIFLRKKDFGAAVKQLEIARNLRGTDVEIKYNLAYAYGMSGKVTLAIAEARESLNLNPSDRDTQKMLVVLYLLARDRERALESFHKLELSGGKAEEWLLKLLFGKRVVSVADLAAR